MIFKKLIMRNKNLLFGILGILFSALSFWTILVPKAEAAHTEKEFIRIKIDSTSSGNCSLFSDCSELWNFFATDDGTIDRFNVTAASYSVDKETYDCGLLLTEEFTGLSDHDQIVWVKKGRFVSRSASLSTSIGYLVDDYLNCCTTSGNAACNMDKSGNCQSDVVTNSDYIFHKTWGTLDEQKCGDDSWGAETPCNSTPSTCCSLSNDYAKKEYSFKYDILCADSGKWAICDDENSCTSDGTNEYACNNSTWENCTSQEKICNSGTCVTATTCDTNPTVAINPTTVSTSAGTTETYTVTVTNSDDASCGSTTFSLSQSGCPNSWTCKLSTASLTIAPGNSDSTTSLTITSPASASTGDIAVVTVTATGSANNSGNATATYSVENCPPNFAASFTKDCYIRQDEVNRYRNIHLKKLIKQEKGNFDELDKEVINAISNRNVISDKNN